MSIYGREMRGTGKPVNKTGWFTAADSAESCGKGGGRLRRAERTPQGQPAMGGCNFVDAAGDLSQ